ncbi:MAG: class I tRNA ligase family protein, partial [Planctomycetota bacterium]
ADGRFTEAVQGFEGVGVKDADKGLIKALKDAGKIFRHETLVHSYPFCWRTDTPLIYKAIKAWYVSVETIKERLVANNKDIHWVPSWVGDRRFGNWLEDARDWNISRNRYWGSCLPIWRCDSPESSEVVCVGSIAELEELCGQKVTDLHKHHVDRLTWPSQDGLGTMRRVPEVFDCWFESGSMPYGQAHYPFENRERFEQNFPAHFIGEGLDQTRGWFYTLLVLSTALFDKPAFENCVVNGLILAEDGRKMSKRERNYTAPEVLIDRFGSDAIRFYMLSSPVVEGQNLRFVDEEVKELVKTLLLPLWNAYRFFSEYANADGWEPTGHVGDATAAGAAASGDRTEALTGTPGDPLDRYVLSELQLTVRAVTEAMEGYQLVKACRAAKSFLETLNNWYIRRSRRRFWKTEDDGDKGEAFEVLYHVLVTYVKLLAPLAPFISERIYGYLKGAEDKADEPRSVHLCDWPEADESHIDEELSSDTAAIRKAISLGHTIRARRRIKTRQPLGRVRVAGLTPRQAEQHGHLLLEELNVKTLDVLEDASGVASKIVKPNARVLGPRLRGDVQKCIKAAKAGDFEELEGGRVRVGEHTLEPNEFEIAWQVEEGVECEAEGALVVLLDLAITDELRREGIARDLVRQLQTLRKDADYAVSDRIHACVASVDDDVAAALDAHEAYLKGEVLALELARDAVGEWDQTRAIELGEAAITIAVRRV